MARADLHVHSKYSDVPSSWLHKAYDSPESFTEPEEVYRQAKSRGMDFVTITDHDDIRGCLELVKAHREDCFISCEITAYFPEDHCKCHILVYGISEDDFTAMSRLRHDLYQLREYIFEHTIAHSVAHAAYDQDGKLSIEHIEKLVLLFDVFEVINGGSDKLNNEAVHRYIERLSAEKITELVNKHGIQPYSAQPWLKGRSGGSDDHCGILIGSAYTEVNATSVSDFLNQLRSRNTSADGLHGSFEIFATGVFKHLHDYKLNTDKKYHKTKLNMVFDHLFVDQNASWLKRFKKSQSLRYLKHKNSATYKALFRLLKELDATSDLDIAEKIPFVYEHAMSLHDEMLKTVLKGLFKNLPDGKFFDVMQKIGSIFPALLFMSPFVGALRHQMLKPALRQHLCDSQSFARPKKVLWVTDTIDDLNGVAVTLRHTADQSHRLGYNLKLVTCVKEENLRDPLPENSINLPPVYATSLSIYAPITLCFPSLLLLMQKFAQEKPEQIIISTPGPLGMTALACAKLMGLPIKGVYHTDFSAQHYRITDDAVMANWVDQSVCWFYRQMDVVYAPSQAYQALLAQRGVPTDKIALFPKAIDCEQYQPKPISVEQLATKELDSFKLIFAGRLSEDKNLSLLAQVMAHLNQHHAHKFELLIAGDGPDIEQYRPFFSADYVRYLGRLTADQLVSQYSHADLMIFPSHTDTFGMVVLEAQACGLPCLVTASGGPQEIIADQMTGKVLASDQLDEWVAAVLDYQALKMTSPQQYQLLKRRCVEHVQSKYQWETMLADLFGDDFRHKTTASQSTDDDNLPSTVVNQ